MKRNVWLAKWKYPSILLFGIGVSNVGGWIYFIALNLIVYDMTQSALAVSVLYLIRPLSTLASNLWAGSLIDRTNKRSLMAILDVIRAVLIVLLPLYSSIWYMYVLVFFIQMASSVFGPTSSTYITMLIPPEQRPRFNSLNALIGSGAFLIGPAIAGLLFLAGSPVMAIYINAAAMFLSGLITLLMPNLEKDAFVQGDSGKLEWSVIKADWVTVLRFYRSHVYVTAVCLLFGAIMMVMASAVDSLEAVFALTVLSLSESSYGLLVSVSGAGIIAGALVNTAVAARAPTAALIGLGVLGVSGGYLLYATSSAFGMAAAGFFVLAFFIAFANAGFATFYQNNIPSRMMGRFGSMNGFIEAILIIITTAVLGLWAEWGSLQAAVIAGVIVMALLSFALGAVLLRKVIIVQKATGTGISVQQGTAYTTIETSRESGPEQ
ncbi:MFS transporter [Paenibacillus sp. 1011MAR3C5]|uniref:MFS transporter n=1 Tax=Paenibacillus sp. 1011MAR3C5 TaxID=1675787 RepID=UPI000E6D3A6B|nr:MFS transporter [Paenibacillus sp. 1011MAR3C5]RJE87550.1 MFS transporter [Paenibacillus sp. 1011MAR3C5]